MAKKLTKANYTYRLKGDRIRLAQIMSKKQRSEKKSD